MVACRPQRGAKEHSAEKKTDDATNDPGEDGSGQRKANQVYAGVSDRAIIKCATLGSDTS